MIATEILEKERALIDGFKGFSENLISEVTLLTKAHTGLCREYDAHINKETDFGFNVFNLISDTYYRENFHSDILRAVLDPKERHCEGNKYLYLFLKLIAENASGTGIKINTANYQNTKVIREQGKVDILILDAVSMKAIIVENKINRAGDMPRQIPRYVEYVEELNYEIDAIVYLVLDDNDSKRPETNTWENGDEEKVFAKFTCLVAFTENKDSLLNGWLLPCQRITKNIDALLILRQYASLIQQLGQKNMNKPIMKAFLESMMEGENYETALSLKSMVGDLLNYRGEKIADAFRNQPEPFDQAYTYGSSAVFGQVKTMRLVLQIYPYEEYYDFTFWDRDFRDGVAKDNLAEQSLQKLNMSSLFRKDSDGTMKRTFKFPSEEDALYEFITEFKSKLGTLETPKAKRKK